MKRVYLHTLGCKVNQFETAAFADSMRDSGLHLVDDPARADVIVINTCAVTAKASAQSRRDLRRLARVNPGAVLAVTGCHVQLAATELRALPDLHPERLLLVGNDRKNELVDFIVHQHRPAVDPSLTDMESARPISRLPIGHFAGRTRALLRVQDGCNHFCSYCIVPFTGDAAAVCRWPRSSTRLPRTGNTGTRRWWSPASMWASTVMIWPRGRP